MARPSAEPAPRRLIVHCGVRRRIDLAASFPRHRASLEGRVAGADPGARHAGAGSGTHGRALLARPLRLNVIARCRRPPRPCARPCPRIREPASSRMRTCILSAMIGLRRGDAPLPACHRHSGRDRPTPWRPWCPNTSSTPVKWRRGNEASTRWPSRPTGYPRGLGSSCPKPPAALAGRSSRRGCTRIWAPRAWPSSASRIEPDPASPGRQLLVAAPGSARTRSRLTSVPARNQSLNAGRP